MSNKLTGGVLFHSIEKNKRNIVKFNSTELNKLWNEKIERFIVTRENFNDQELNQAYNQVKEKYYNERAFLKLEPEMSQAYNQWYKGVKWSRLSFKSRIYYDDV